MGWICHLRPEALPEGWCSPEMHWGRPWCPLSSARTMDGPKVSVFTVIRIIGFQSSRDQVVGLTVRSQWSPLSPHWLRSKEKLGTWSNKSWLIDHSITRGRIERQPAEMVLGIYDQTKLNGGDPGCHLNMKSGPLAQCRNLSQISNVAPLTEDMTLLPKDRTLPNHSKYIYCEDSLSSSVKEYA